MTRKPTQKRAKATVEAIVDAGFICVAKRGLEATTTRHIAETAGIGIGSLYEYFSNKDEIYRLMYSRLVSDVALTIKSLVPELVTLPINQAIRRILYTVGTLLQRDDRRYLRCARYALQADMKMDMEPLTKLLMDVILQYVLHQPRYMRVRNIPAMNYIFIHGSVFTLMHHLSEQDPAIGYEALVNGLADMVGHYAEHELALLDAPPLRDAPTDASSAGFSPIV